MAGSLTTTDGLPTGTTLPWWRLVMRRTTVVHTRQTNPAMQGGGGVGVRRRGGCAAMECCDPDETGSNFDNGGLDGVPVKF